MKRQIPRQWFFDEVRPSWVRNTSLVTDELQRVVKEMKTYRFIWTPSYRRLARQFDDLKEEYAQLRFSHIRSQFLRAGDAEVEANVSKLLYPNNPFLWKKKEEGYK